MIVIIDNVLIFCLQDELLECKSVIIFEMVPNSPEEEESIIKTCPSSPTPTPLTEHQEGM